MTITIHIHLHILQVIVMATLLSTLLILLGHTLIIVLHLIRAMEVILEVILHTHHRTTIIVTTDKGDHQDHLHMVLHLVTIILQDQEVKCLCQCIQE